MAATGIRYASGNFATAADLVTAGGLVYITGGSVTAGSAININNCFTTTYDNYRLVLTSNVVTTMRLRVSAADNSTANYADQYVQGSVSTAGAGRNTGATSWAIKAGSVNASAMTVDLYNPALAVVTSGLEVMADTTTGPNIAVLALFHNVASAFDGFSILGTTMTASVKVFGYKNS